MTSGTICDLVTRWQHRLDSFALIRGDARGAVDELSERLINVAIREVTLCRNELEAAIREDAGMPR